MKTSTTSKFGALLFAAILAGAPALAAGEDPHEGKHGGKLVESGHHHVEIVAKDDLIEVYVNGEDGKPENVKEAKATAAILSEGKKIDITLAPESDDVLKGKGTFKAVKGTTIVVTLTMPGHQPEQSRIKLD